MKKDTDPLEHELRQLRLADPDPELRRRTLLAARAALRASVPAPAASRLAGKIWWRELALAAAALLLFVSLPEAPPAHVPAKRPAAAPEELRAALGIDPELARYLNTRMVPAGPGPAGASFRSSKDVPF